MTLKASDLTPGLFTCTLPGGLRVLIKEDRRSPVAICNVWVRVGSNREPEPLRGWSHGIEHMLFKGTGRREAGDFALEVASAGGSTNAGTGYETTNYHITVPAEKLATAVDILGDALFHSSFEKESLDAERQVLVHENHMYDDIPFGFGVTWRWGMELTFDRSPYRYPIGGQDQNLLDRSREEIMDFWRSAYRLDNMAVVIVGDVDAPAAVELIQERFPDTLPAGDSIPESSRIVAAPAVEPPHESPRIRLETGDIQKAYAKLIFPIPGEGEELAPVLNVVRRVLSDGRSCRLNLQVLEQKQLVDEYTVMTETGPREGVFMVDLETDPDRLAAALKEVASILGDLKAQSCTEAELDRAVIRVQRGHIFGLETVQGQAGQIGHYDSVDDLAGAFEFPDRVARVRRTDVADFCQQAFRIENLNAMIYLPEGTDPAAYGIPTDVDGLTRLLRPVLDDVDLMKDGAGEPEIDAVEVAGSKSKVNVDRPQTGFLCDRLSNGIEVWHAADPTLPILGISLTCRGGACGESKEQAGLSAMTHMVQVKGTAALEAEPLHEYLEGQGASISPQADRDYGGLYLSCLSSRLDPALEQLGAMILEPSFPEVELDRERRLAIQQLAAIADNAFQHAALHLRQLIYGDHPYGRPLSGTEDSLNSLTRNDLVARNREAWTAENLQIIAAGDFDPEHLVGWFEKHLGDLPGQESTPVLPSPGPSRKPEGVVAERIVRQQNQSVLLTGWPGPANPEEDRVPLMMLKEVLNGQSGRLFEVLRNQQSLCYNTGILSTAGFGQGMLVGYVLTSPEGEDQAREALLKELAAMAQAEVPTEEFERARAKLIGNLLISHQSGGARVARAARDRIYLRPADEFLRLIDSLRNCRAAEVKQTAAKYLDPEQRFEVVLGPA